MKSTQLTASPRTTFGKAAVRQFRKDGHVPCAMYDATNGNQYFTVPQLALDKLLADPNTYLINLELGNETPQCLLKDVEFHPVFDNPLHADFQRVDPGKPVEVELPLRLTGNPVGVLAGGKLVKKLRTIRLRGLLEHMPDSVDVEIGHLAVGRTVKISDLSFDNIRIMMKPDVAVASVEVTRALRQEASAKSA